MVYRHTTHISHEGTNVNERWPAISVLKPDSSSHASSYWGMILADGGVSKRDWRVIHVLNSMILKRIIRKKL